MKYVFYSPLDESVGIVTAVYDETEITEDLKAGSIPVAEVPVMPVVTNGYAAALHVKLADQSLYYEVAPVETAESVAYLTNKLKTTEERLSSTEDALFQIMFGGM